MKTLSNNFRIKIDMSNVAVNPSRVWLLVNPDDCSNVKLLKKKIVDKFSLLYSRKQFDVVLQDFIIPEDESIEIIKCDDVISLRRRLKVSKSKPEFLIDNENDVEASEIALSQVDDHSEKRKRKKSIQLKTVQHTPVIEINSKKRKRKKLSMDEKCERIHDLEDAEDISIDAQDFEDFENNETKKSLMESSQVCEEVDYVAMFPLPKKRRRRHRKKSPVKAHKNDDVIQNVVEKPFGSFSLQPRDYDDTEHVRRHLRFADDEDDKVRKSESSKIERIIETPQSILDKETLIVEETLPEQKVIENQPIDLSKFERLLGPPRLNDHVCYQVLEIAEDYSPQVSSLRVGKVKSFDPNLKIVTVEFDKPIVTKPRKGKFELIDKIESENYNEEEEIEEEEEIILIENESCNLDQMIELKVRV